MRVLNNTEKYRFRDGSIHKFEIINLARVGAQHGRMKPTQVVGQYRLLSRDDVFNEASFHHQRTSEIQH